MHLHATLSTFSHLVLTLYRTGMDERHGEGQSDEGGVIDITLARAI